VPPLTTPHAPRPARPAVPVFYAHRGATAELPENTMPAFRRALELGAVALEMDVHMTRDGVIVVSHDPDGARMAGVPRAFRDVPLAEARRWNMGAGFVARDGRRPFAAPQSGSPDSADGGRFRVPTFEEVLEELPPVPLNVDLKQSTPSMAATIVDLVRRHGACDRVTLASFELRNLIAVRRLGYEGPTGLSRPEVAALLAMPRSAFRRLPLTGSAAQLPTHVGRIRLDTRRVIDRCHELGLRVDYWTIDDPAEAERLLDLGADGIMTDDPAAIAPVFARRGAGGAPPGRAPS
jgi:glycerophosphoryl diester phosphodiesterase